MAWTEITRVCSDLVSDVTKGLEQNTEWQIELLDAFKKPLFRVRVVAESFEASCLIGLQFRKGAVALSAQICNELGESTGPRRCPD